MSDTSSSSCESSSESESFFEILPDQTVLDKFEDYRANVAEIEAAEDKSTTSIDFSRKFMTSFALFQEALKRNELSERTLTLTRSCIKLNPANYTVWYFRRIILFALNKDLNEELNFIDDMIDENAKNYQIWQHRKCIVKRLKDASREKLFTKRVLIQDSKNYHCWQHRQWFVNKFNLFDGELDYIDSLLNADVRNNSAWNHRYFVMEKTGRLTNKDDEDFNREIKYVINKIVLAPNNESSWNYLVGILGDNNLNSNSIVNQFIEDFKANGEVTSSFFYAFKLDQIMLRLENDSTNKDLAKTALDLSTELATVYDKIREKYWNYIGQTIKVKYLKDE